MIAGAFDETTSKYFNDVLADVEWQDGVSSSQRAIMLNFAHEMILDAALNGTNVERVYTQTRESLRKFANLARDSFTLRRGETTVVVEKIHDGTA